MTTFEVTLDPSAWTEIGFGYSYLAFDGLNAGAGNVLKTSGGQEPRVTFFLNVWNPKITDTRYVIRRFKIDTSVSNDLVRTYKIPIKLDPTDVVWITASTTQNNTSVDAELDILEVRQAAT